MAIFSELWITENLEMFKAATLKGTMAFANWSVLARNSRPQESSIWGIGKGETLPQWNGLSEAVQVLQLSITSASVTAQVLHTAQGYSSGVTHSSGLQLRVTAQGCGSSQGKRVPSELPQDKVEAGLYRKRHSPIPAWSISLEICTNIAVLLWLDGKVSVLLVEI